MGKTKDWRYTPRNVLTLKRGYLNVVTIKAHPPNSHNASPIVNSMTALELIDSEGGSHWYGVEGAMINSELRMIVYGGFINPRNELAKVSIWKPAKHVP